MRHSAIVKAGKCPEGSKIRHRSGKSESLPFSGNDKHKKAPLQSGAFVKSIAAV
jgi:hypothetical protein